MRLSTTSFRDWGLPNADFTFRDDIIRQKHKLNTTLRIYHIYGRTARRGVGRGANPTETPLPLPIPRR